MTHSVCVTTVEVIPANFVPPSTGSAVRLFNLAYDISSATLTTSAGKTIATGIHYSNGSAWEPVTATAQTFSATGPGGQKLASAIFTPPTAPEVFTGTMIEPCSSASITYNPAQLDLTYRGLLPFILCIFSLEQHFSSERARGDLAIPCFHRSMHRWMDRVAL